MMGWMAPLRHLSAKLLSDRISREWDPKHHDKTVEGYRQLAEKCRQNACTVSAEKERSRLLEMAQIWDLIAERIGRAAP
jgi:thymidylate kinase